MRRHKPLPESSLYRRCDPELIPFDNTGEVAVSNEIFGQRRALDAIAFGTSIDRAGYNIFLLREFDPEFAELFKVAADFDDEIDRDAGNTDNYARFLANLAQSHKLRPFDRAAIARLMEQFLQLRRQFKGGKGKEHRKKRRHA